MRARSTCASRWPTATSRACASMAAARWRARVRSARAPARRALLDRAPRRGPEPWSQARRASASSCCRIAAETTRELLNLSLGLLQSTAGAAAARGRTECSVRCGHLRRRPRRSVPGWRRGPRTSRTDRRGCARSRPPCAQIRETACIAVSPRRRSRVADRRLEHRDPAGAARAPPPAVCAPPPSVPGNARRRRLALQMANLLLDLLAQIVQSIEVLARLSDAVFGLAAPLFVARNTGRLFQKGP